MNSFGRLFRIGIFGESHGDSIGVVIDGCPPGIPLTQEDFLADLARRKAGPLGTSPRRELDRPRLISGIFRKKTTGAPITIVFKNTNPDSSSYKERMNIPRPGHADFVATLKYRGYNDFRGGGHFSGRLTLGLVAAGVIAKKLIRPTKVHACLTQAGGDQNIARALRSAIDSTDSIGGIIEGTVTHMLPCLGEPFFDSLESLLSHALFSIPGVKGVEFGAGFAAATMYGSEYNDRILDATGKTKTNHTGGINGGISNGNDLFFRVVARPTSSIAKVQHTYDFRRKHLTALSVAGSHDVCIALRMPVIVEAVAATVLADLCMLHNASKRVLR